MASAVQQIAGAVAVASGAEELPHLDAGHRFTVVSEDHFEAGEPALARCVLTNKWDPASRRQRAEALQGGETIEQRPLRLRAIHRESSSAPTARSTASSASGSGPRVTPMVIEPAAIGGLTPRAI